LAWALIRTVDFVFERNDPTRFCNDSLACHAFKRSRKEKQAECPARAMGRISRKDWLPDLVRPSAGQSVVDASGGMGTIVAIRKTCLG